MLVLCCHCCYVKATVAEGYNGFHARFSKCTGEISDCDCNIQLSTAIQLFNSDSSFWLPTRNCRFQRLTTISTFNRDSVFQCSTAIAIFNRDSVFQRSTAIPTFSHDSNFQLRFQFSTMIPCMLVCYQHKCNRERNHVSKSKFIN